MTTKLLAYHGDPAIKAKYVARYEAHRAADEVRQGDPRRCFVGCTLDRYDHSGFPDEIGWPEWLARLAEQIFESLPLEEAPQSGSDLHAAIEPGVDLEQIKHAVSRGALVRCLGRLERNREHYAAQCRAAIESLEAAREYWNALEIGAGTATQLAEKQTRVRQVFGIGADDEAR